jgi:hypothetical protein
MVPMGLPKGYWQRVMEVCTGKLSLFWRTAEANQAEES